MDAMEIELKVRVATLEGLEDRLRAAGFRESVPFGPEQSTLWDREGALREKRQAVRVRSYGGITSLTWKGPRSPDPMLKIRPEVETQVANREALEAILRALDLAPTMEMTKVRATWVAAGLMVCLDQTPFGCFVEIEGSQEAILVTRSALGLDDAEVETRSYPALFEQFRLGG